MEFDRRNSPPNQNAMLLLAVLWSTGFFAVLAALLAKPGSNPDMMIGALISVVQLAIGYYFGSSKGASDKDAVIATMSKTASKTADNVGDAANGLPAQVGDVAMTADKVVVNSDNVKKGTS